MDQLILARIQFAANITFHIFFPAITISLGWILFYFKIKFTRSTKVDLVKDSRRIVSAPLCGDPQKWIEAYKFWVKIFAGALFLYLNQLLKTLPRKNDQKCWLPFLLVMLIFVVGFAGLAYSFFPYIIPGSTTIWEAASSPQSLKIILVGTLVVLPTILIYTFFVHKIFWGKTTQLTYY